MQGMLRGQRRLKCVGCSCEGSVKSITRRLDHMTAVPQDALPHQRVVTRKGNSHRLPVMLPKRRAAFDVGEKERYGPDG